MFLLPLSKLTDRELALLANDGLAAEPGSKPAYTVLTLNEV